MPSTLGRTAVAETVSRSYRLQAAILSLALTVVSLHAQQPASQSPEEGFRFKSGVELINVTASVSDATGRFVPDLQKEDFVVYEDGQIQAVTQFSAERVPVSLGIAPRHERQHGR